MVTLRRKHAHKISKQKSIMVIALAVRINPSQKQTY